MGFLKRKYGPLPVWGWAATAVLLVVGYVIYKRRAAQSSSAGAPVAGPQAGSYIPASATGDAAAAQAGQPSQNSSPADSLSPDVLSQLLGPGGPLPTAIEDVATAIYNNGAGGYATATGTPPQTPETTATTTPGASTGGPVPITITVKTQPTVSSPKPAAAKPTRQTPAPKRTAAVRYFTRKSQVKLKRGQSVHFKKGLGYFAA